MPANWLGAVGALAAALLVWQVPGSRRGRSSRCHLRVRPQRRRCSQVERVFWRPVRIPTETLQIVDEPRHSLTALKVLSVDTPASDYRSFGSDYCHVDVHIVVTPDWVALSAHVRWKSGTVGEQVEHDNSTASPTLREPTAPPDSVIVNNFIGGRRVQADKHRGGKAGIPDDFEGIPILFGR